MQARSMAIVHIAMFEALNSITPRYTPYRARLPVEPGTSPDAAAAAAAHHALSKLFPDQAKDFDAALQAALAKVPEGAAKANGIRLGERSAAAILAEREQDGATAPITYRPFTTARQVRADAVPGVLHLARGAAVRLKSGDQFRPPAPYALASAQWAADYNEVKRMGARPGRRARPTRTTSRASGRSPAWRRTTRSRATS
jgi:hypothetical protein